MIEPITQPQTVPNIFQKIMFVMKELDYIQKGEKTVNNQYRFVSHDQVTAKIHPLLVKYGIAIVPSVEELKQENNRTSIRLAVAFVNADCPSDQFTTHHYGFGVDPGDKGPGKAISYAFKYCLLKTFCLQTGDDPDQDQNAVYEPEKCLEFDLQLPVDMKDKERAKLEKFLAYSSECMHKHVEEVKREALKRMPEFLAAFRNWNPKKKEE